jgi:hypothetical protein
VKAVLQGLGCVALLAVAWLAAESAYSIRYARQRSVYTFDQLNKVLRETSQTLDEVRKGATTWNQASKEQSTQTTQAMSRVSAVAGQLSLFVTRTDESINAHLLPTLTESIREQNASLLTNEETLTGSLKQIGETTNQAQKVLIDADAVISSPKLQETLASTAESAHNLSKATADGAATMADVRKAVEYEVHQLMAPITKIRAAFNISLDVLKRLYF